MTTATMTDPALMDLLNRNPDLTVEEAQRMLGLRDERAAEEAPVRFVRRGSGERPIRSGMMPRG